jgi:hypothetical protein
MAINIIVLEIALRWVSTFTLLKLLSHIIFIDDLDSFGWFWKEIDTSVHFLAEQIKYLIGPHLLRIH